MSTTLLNLPTKACHNCRKRRWRCDRSLPTCQKCLSSGAECLGYGKLFKWNSGVASRGKMMGKTYEERLEVKPEAKIQEAPPLVWNHEIVPSQPQQDPSPESRGDWSTESTTSSEQSDDSMAMTVYRPLADPLLNDLDRSSRYYLYHFATQLCDVMVVYDMPGQNPIRDLIPATSEYPLLLHILVANSAFHVFNISRNPMGQSTYQEKQSPGVMAYYQAVSRFGGPLKSSYKDALVAKQQALSLLAQSVATVNETNIDLILATILMFVNYALVESGRDKWKVHLDGALRLIQLLGEPPYLQRPMSRLRQTILSDFLVFYILGSTFTFSAMPAFIPETIELDPILRYAETNNYLSCPGPLLRIMLESFALPPRSAQYTDEMYQHIQDQTEVFLRRALAFDPVAWSCELEPASPFEDINQRIRIAAAHRSAVCIYLARALSMENPLLDPTSDTAIVNLPALSADIVHHISYLKPGDALFKSICWPLFLAGAESRNAEHRQWIMNKLDQLYDLMFWGYLHTSKRVLETIWKYVDAVEAGGEKCWVDQILGLGNEVLIA